MSWVQQQQRVSAAQQGGRAVGLHPADVLRSQQTVTVILRTSSLSIGMCGSNTLRVCFTIAITHRTLLGSPEP